MKSSYKSKRRRETIETEGSFPEKIKNKLGEQAGLIGGDFFEQLLGLGSSITSEQKNESVVFELSKEKNREEKIPKKKIKAEAEPGINYHREYYESISRFSERASYREVMQESRKIQQVMAEIRKLASSTKLLQVEFGLVTVEEAPVNPGQYYVNFFEWMLIMIKQARQKVEDSKSWLETVKGKKGKKGYWDKAKKHGTTFSQANERFVATSTG
jgi:hypothetical protein